MDITRRFLLQSSAAAAFVGSPFSFAMAQDGKAGGSIVVVSTQSPRHLNPAVQSGAATAVPGAQIFASPLMFDADWKPHPYLAESWTVADDALSVTLNLVKGATFHDGKPITSDDVRFSIETIKANHPFTTMYAPVTAIETPDEHTAVIRLAHPHPALLLCLSGALCPIIPRHVFGDGQDVKNHPANAAPVGSGPYKLEEFTPGQKIVLAKNENFFLKDRPLLDKIIVTISNDPNAMLLAVENGEADAYPFATASQDIKRLEKVERLHVSDKGFEGIGALNWLAFNTKKAPLDNKAVRQAIGYAIDRDFIINALMRGVAKAQRSPIIESSPFFNPDIPAYDHDLDKANAMLDEAGHKAGADGIRFKLTVDYIPGAPEQQEGVAQYLKLQLKKAGIDVEVRASPDFPTWAQRISNFDFDMTMDAVYNWGDPVIGVHRTYLSSNIKQGVIWSNTQQYSNPKVDELLAEAATESDPARRKALYDEFQMIVGEDLPIYFINSLPYHSAYDRQVVDFPESIWGMMQSMADTHWNKA